MNDAIEALKAAMSNDPTIEIHELKQNEDIFDFYNPIDCLHYRKEKVIVDGVEKQIRRTYYYKAGNASGYCNVGWVLNNDCDACLKCNTPFSVFTAKHHCRVW